MTESHFTGDGMTRACKDCAYWVRDAQWNQHQTLQLKKLSTASSNPTEWVQERLEYYQKNGDGRCHFNPPVAACSPNSSVDALASFPLVGSNSWCRQWAAREG